MTLLLLDTEEGVQERQQVRYAEQTHSGGVPGTAIQFRDGETEFVRNAHIAGTYDEDVVEPMEDKFEAMVDPEA